MSQSIQASWQQLSTAYNERPLRERGLILATTLVLLLFVLGQLLIAPALSRASLSQKNTQRDQTELQQIQSQIALIEARLAVDPNTALRDQLQRLTESNQQLDRAFAQASLDLVDPQVMVGLLRDMIAEQKNLQLISLQNLPPRVVYSVASADGQANEQTAAAKPTAGAKATANETPVPAIYAHEIQVVLTGDYFSVLDYLQRLESLDARFGWRSIRYEVKTYPHAEATLRVQTLSLNKAWLGV